MATPASIYVAVIDDDESMRRSMVRLLAAAHFRPIAYASAEEFLADEKRPQFDCLVLDIWLEGMRGIELRRLLGDSPPAPPVIFITAHDDAQIRDEAQSVGCAGYYRKLDDGGAIIEAIRRLAEAGPKRSREACSHPAPKRGE
jgi:FixJ family two-component response regulator